MMLVLRISSTLALVLACALLVASGVRWRRADAEAFRKQRGVALSPQHTIAEGESGLSHPVAPLVRQAEAFAAHLAGPENPESDSVAAPPPACPPAPILGLTLHATSYYPDQPRRSMALISLTSAPQEEPRWVKEGTRIDVFVVHEIRPSMIVYRQGDQLREAAVANRAGLPSLVRDLRQGLHPVGDARPLGAWRADRLAVDANGIEIGHN